MMERMVARGAEIARRAEARQVERVADQMRALLGDAAVSTFETRVMVHGRDILLRWLTEPALRFLRQVYK